MFYFALVIWDFHVLYAPRSCWRCPLAGSLAYSIYLKGRKTVKVFVFGMLPACLVMMVINPMFSHEGETILFYLDNGNPITLESILYGIGSGTMLACVVSWFSAFHEVMTSDKFMYLFGRVIPCLFSAFVHVSAVCSKIYRTDQKSSPGSAMHRTECKQRQDMGEGPSWTEDSFYYHHLGPGKFRRDSRLYEIKSLWTSGKDKFLNLSV